MTIAEPLGPKYAPTQLLINLDAIIDNYKLLSDLAVPATCGAVVKANAYGLGMLPISRALSNAGCQTFFVALLDEAIALRVILPTARILVLNGILKGEGHEFCHSNLIPVLNDLHQIEIWSEFCQSNEPYPAALHFDTGMARLGLTPSESELVLTNFDELPFPIASLISHLACADDPSHSLNRKQLNQFLLISRRLPMIPASLSASSGIFLGSDWHLDIVRPGASIYGISPTLNLSNPMRQTIRLQGKILQIRLVDTLQTVGYGATHKFSKPARIATVAAGYADGYMRCLGSRGVVYIGDTPVPVVGRVSMDLITIDVTNVEGEIEPGDMVDLIGPKNDVNTLASSANTIGYEVLTSLGQRYRRTYMGDPK